MRFGCTFAEMLLVPRVVLVTPGAGTPPVRFRRRRPLPPVACRPRLNGVSVPNGSRLSVRSRMFCLNTGGDPGGRDPDRQLDQAVRHIRAAATRQRILIGMLEAVGSEGYEGATVQSALGRAGVDRQTFLSFFGGKEDCFLAALDRGIAWAEAIMRGAATGETSWRDQLRSGLAGLLGFLDDEPDVGRALLLQVHLCGPRAVAKWWAAVERAATLVDRGREEGDLDAPAIAGAAIVGSILTVLRTRLSLRRNGDLERLLPELMYLAVLPYFGPEEAVAELRPAP